MEGTELRNKIECLSALRNVFLESLLCAVEWWKCYSELKQSP